ncbi:MAG: proline racemase family protein [Bacteroidota bacterium]|nr:proline racemase family protein [Bacteroidota bacterium]
MSKFFSGWDWQPPAEWLKIETLEMHTGGEPLRVYLAGLPDIPGNTILDKRAYFKNRFDHIRTGTMWEPRGHADMYGAILTEPTTPDADFGVFFLHNEGYSTMCGHAIIALTKMAYETGLVPKNKPELIINAPPGKIFARPHHQGDKIENVSFINVPSFALLKNQTIDIEGIGRVNFDVAFGGAFYAFVNAEKVGLKLTEPEADRCIDYGQRIKLAVMNEFEIIHPFEKDLSFLYGTIFIGPANNPANHSRNVCIFANGELDRSATGSGISARAALHYSRDEIKKDQVITIESILGTTMNVTVRKQVSFGPYNAVIPEISGTAHITGRNTFYFDPEDPLNKGFILR